MNTSTRISVKFSLGAMNCNDIRVNGSCSGPFDWKEVGQILSSHTCLFQRSFSNLQVSDIIVICWLLLRESREMQEFLEHLDPRVSLWVICFNIISYNLMAVIRLKMMSCYFILTGRFWCKRWRWSPRSQCKSQAVSTYFHLFCTRRERVSGHS